MNEPTGIAGYCDEFVIEDRPGKRRLRRWPDVKLLFGVYAYLRKLLLITWKEFVKSTDEWR
jgi:hypothetical protein